MGLTSELEYLKKERRIKITDVKISHCPQIHVFGGCIPWISIITLNREFRSKYSHELKSYDTDESIEISFKMPFEIEKDFKITFYSKGKVIKKSE
jgi:hypothetical protein